MMETHNLKCPTCGQPVTEHEHVFTCAEHGDWMLYGTRLLVRRPTDEVLRRESVIMPWEKRVLRAA